MQPNRVVESLEFAAEGLDTAATGAEVRAAIRDGLLGLEYHLDTLTAGGIVGRFITGGNPRDMLRVKNATNAFRKLVEAQFPKA